MPETYSKPTLYIEPNYNPVLLEDFNIYVDLRVEIKKKKVSPSMNEENKVYLLQWEIGDGAKKTATLFGGTPLKTSDGKTGRYLTTRYSNTYLADIRKGESSVEDFGIESIDIEFNSYYVPQVTIKFTDIRGVSIFSKAEDNHTDYYQGVGGYDENDIVSSFFNAFFVFPYPTFTLLVKGFYGQPAIFTLNCADFRATFQASTGKFGAIAKFVGYTASFLADVSLNALLCAPYSDAGGADYWKQRKSELGDDFYLVGKDKERVEMVTMAELITKLSKMDDEIKEIVNNSEAGKKQSELEDKQASLSTLNEALDTFYQALHDHDWGGNCKPFFDVDKRHIVILSKYGGVGDEVDSDISIIDIADEAWEGVTELDGGKILNVVKEAAEKAFKNNVTSKVISGIVSLFQDDNIKQANDNLIAVCESMFPGKNYVGKIYEHKNVALFNTKKNNSGKYDYNPIESAWEAQFKNCLKDIQAAIAADGGKEFEGDYYKNGITFGFDIAKKLQEENDKITEEKAKNEEELKKVEEGAMSMVLGFKPSIYNFTKIIMASMEVYMKLLYDCAETIYNNPQDRTRAALNMDGIYTDMNKAETSEDFVPPFPKVGKEKDVPRRMGAQSEGEVSQDGETTDDGGVRRVGGNSKTMRVIEEEWIGSISSKFVEASFVNGLLNGAKEVGKIMYEAMEQEAGDMDDGGSVSDRTTAVAHPVVPSDMVGIRNPWGSMVFDSDADFVGKCFFRMQQLFCVPGNNGVDPARIGEIDAENFSEQNGPPKGNILKLLKAKAQSDTDTMGFDDYFMKIITGNGGDEYKNKGAWPWNSKMQKASGLANNNLSTTLKINDVDVVPMEPDSFDEISTQLSITDDGCSLPREKDPFYIQNDYPTEDKLVEGGKFVLKMDAKWGDYQRFYSAITEEYSDVKPNFVGCEYSKSEYESWYDKDLSEFIPEVNFESMEEISTTLSIKRMPGFSMDKDRDSAKEASVFGQLMFYKQTSNQAKAFMVLKALDVIGEDDWYEHFVEKLRDDNRHFLIAPRWMGLSIGADIWYNGEGKEKLLKADGFKGYDSAYPKDTGKRLRSDMEQILLNAFIAWSNGDFKSLENAYRLSFIGPAETAIKNIIDKEQDFWEHNEIELYLRNSDEHHLKVYINQEDFLQKYVGDEKKPDEVSYIKDEMGFRLNLNPEVSHPDLVSLVLVPSMYATCGSHNSHVGSKSGGEVNVPKDKASSYWTSFVKVLAQKYQDVNEDVDESESGITLKTSSDTETPIDLRVALYHYSKAFFDKWVAGTNREEDFDNTWKLSNFFSPDDTKGGRFHFIDSFFNYVGDSMIVNPQVFVDDLKSCTSEDGYTLLSLLSDLFSKNRFDFVCMENFLDLGDPVLFNDMFKQVPYEQMVIRKSKPDFVAMYKYEPSSKMQGNHPDDSFMLNHADMLPLPITSKNMQRDYTVPAFGVAYGMMNQNYFYDIDVSMEKPMVTEESIRVQYQLCGVHADTARARQYVTYGQDLFTIFSNNSYTCTVTMMGNAWIRPLMYFCLTNVPMFRGSYLIQRVRHSITPGQMTTTFTGVRMANTSSRVAKNWMKKAYVDVDENSYASNGYYSSEGSGGSSSYGGGASGGGGSGIRGRDSSLAHDGSTLSLLLERTVKAETYTEGILYKVETDGNLVRLCDTVEDKDRGLTNTMSSSEVLKVKKKHETAIPSGQYKLDPTHKTGKNSLFSSQRASGGYLPEILNIPGFSGVLLHGGSSARSSSGCIILGTKSGEGTVSNSSAACGVVNRDTILAAHNEGKKCSILIRDARGGNWVDKLKPSNYIHNLPSGFVYLKKYIPDLVTELRYYTPNNFVGKKLPGYESNVAICTLETAQKLQKAAEQFRKDGYRIKVWDAYRPVSAHRAMQAWAKNNDTSTKQRYYPSLQKSSLLGNYIASTTSRHCKGNAVDFTLVDSSGKEIDMGSPFDLFSSASNRGDKIKPGTYDGYKITQAHIKNRNYLRTVVEQASLKTISSEWWHVQTDGNSGAQDFPVK